MNVYDVLGLIFSNAHDDQLGGIATVRTMGSVPFGGRYRLIDFPLSNMVNSGIDTVAVIAKSNYQSLMDHLESGKSWDLARKKGGLKLFPPFGSGRYSGHQTRLESIFAIRSFLSSSKQKYIVVCDCDLVANIDFREMVKAHIQNNAHITFGVVPNCKAPADGEYMFLNCDGEKVKDILISPENMPKDAKFCPGVFVIDREILLNEVINAYAKGQTNLYKDIFAQATDRYHMVTYAFGGSSFVISSLGDYVKANMALLDIQARRELFDSKRPIYTKIYDEMPVKYGLGSLVKNSLIADGCQVEGEVENSVLFRGVKIAKGAKVKNSIIFPLSTVMDNADMEYVVADKNTVIEEGRVFKGGDVLPFYIKKGTTI